MDEFLNISFIHDVVVLSHALLFNLYFAALAIPFGFPFAVLLALAKNRKQGIVALCARTYIYAFRGSPLFIQFFMFYAIALALNKPFFKPLGIDHVMLHPLFLGPFVLVLNTAAYAAEIFYGALQSIPRGEVEAARAVGMSNWQVFKTAVWPNMIRLSWPAYTNEVVFLFHATALVYFTLPVIDAQQDLMNKASELFEKDYNVFLHYSVAALYFLLVSVTIFYISNKIYLHLTRHMRRDVAPLKLKPNYLR